MTTNGNHISTADITKSTESINENDNKFLTFRLGGEEYGVEILSVREIIGVIDITPLPQTPEFVKGVINLRGKIIPVMDLRTRFILQAIDYTEETCIIVVEITSDTDDDSHQIGIIVDTVSEVLDIPRDQIEPPPAFGNAVSAEYILGMGKLEERVVILLNINKVLTDIDMQALRSASTSTSDPVAENNTPTNKPAEAVAATEAA